MDEEEDILLGEVQDEAGVLAEIAPVKKREVRSAPEPKVVPVVARAPGLSVATVAVVGVFSLVVLVAAAATIVSVASRAARRQASSDVLGLHASVVGVAAADGSGHDLGHGLEIGVGNAEKMKNL